MVTKKTIVADTTFNLAGAQQVLEKAAKSFNLAKEDLSKSNDRMRQATDNYQQALIAFNEGVNSVKEATNVKPVGL